MRIGICSDAPRTSEHTRVLGAGRGAFFVGAFALMACTQPTYPPQRDGSLSGPLDAQVLSDAGAPPDVAQFGDAQLDDAVVAVGVDAATFPPDWARPLIGRYAKRIVTFGKASVLGNPTLTRGVELALVTIVLDDHGELVMTSQLCTLSADWPGAPVTYNLASNTGVPATRQRIHLGDAPKFSAEGASRRIGFDPAREERCAGMVPHTQLSASADQVWLTDHMCECPGNPATPPDSPNDCRLTNPDGDDLPGITVIGNFFGSGPGAVSMVFDTSFMGFEGEVHADGMHLVDEDYDGAVLCVNAAVDQCGVGSTTPCPIVQTLLVPLAADATCATVQSDGVQRLPPTPAMPPTECAVTAP